jgi:hypothetical protein
VVPVARSASSLAFIDLKWEWLFFLPLPWRLLLNRILQNSPLARQGVPMAWIKADSYIINLDHVLYIDDLEDGYVIHFGTNGDMRATVKKNTREADALKSKLAPMIHN